MKKMSRYVIACLAASVAASHAAVITVDYSVDPGATMVVEENYAAASYNNTLQAAGVRGYQQAGTDITTFAAIIRGGGVGQVVLGNATALDFETVIINDTATVDQSLYTDVFLGLNSSWGTVTDPGSLSVMAQIGGTWYVSDEMTGTIGGGDTALTELDGFTASDTVWHAWEADLTDGFNYASIGAAQTLPAGTIQNTGWLMQDTDGDIDASYTKHFAVVAIPEPATLGTVVASAGGLLLIRRRFMI